MNNRTVVRQIVFLNNLDREQTFFSSNLLSLSSISFCIDTIWSVSIKSKGTINGNDSH